MEINCFKRFGDEDVLMEEVSLHLQEDVLIIKRISIPNKVDGYLPISNVKVEFFENLSD